MGSTNNIEKRVGCHNAGRVKSTKPYLPWRVVYTESFGDISSARRRELQVKSWKKRSAIEKLIGAIV